jgi:ribose/xylose/arabinose/galactoside ABC-type transport system permease subunit
MNDWRFWFAEQRGTFLAIAIFVVMFFIYASNHPAGFSADVVQTASNKGVLLAFVAMSQALVVITAGIDLSVGMVFTLTNCLASWVVVGSPPQVALGVVVVLQLTGSSSSTGVCNPLWRRSPLGLSILELPWRFVPIRVAPLMKLWPMRSLVLLLDPSPPAS